jgi:hypothetical protein
MPSWPGGDIAIVASHDCDVSSEDLAREPSAEILTAAVADHADGNLKHGKNPRQIQISVSDDTGDMLYTANIDNRIRIDRKLLADVEPDDARRLDDDDRTTLPRWLTKRYDRAAFPDAFNNRVKTASSKIKRRLKTGGVHITGIWIGLQTERELPDDQEYDLQLWCVMKTEDYDEKDRRLKAQECAQDVAALVNGCQGLTVIHDTLAPEFEMTMENMRVLDRWDYDDLTIREPLAHDPIRASDA